MLLVVFHDEVRKDVMGTCSESREFTFGFGSCCMVSVALAVTVTVTVCNHCALAMRNLYEAP